MTKIDIRALRETERANRGNDRERLRAAHEAGIRGVKEGRSYRETVANHLHGAQPRPTFDPADPLGNGSTYRRGDPLFGHDAVMRRGVGLRGDPDSTFQWPV